MKPLSQKTVQNNYLKADIKESERELLRKYLLCFSNLYGCIQVDELWEVFKNYDENFTKKKFFDFIDINQREENEYLILNLNEAYTGETSTSTKDKLLTNKKLVKRFDTKFWYLHRLEECKDVRHGPYVPNKEELFKFDHDVFYKSDAGKAMVNFVSNLKASGYEYNKYKNTKKTLLDVNGNSIKDKFLKDIVCYSNYEKFDIDYCKNEKQKAYLISEANITCQEKILNKIKRFVLIENPDEFTDSVQRLLDYITCDFGVDLKEESVKEFLDLYVELTNSSNRWSMFGWNSIELTKTTPINNCPIELQIGPNMQKMFESGEYDLKEMEKFIKDKNLNITISKTQDKEDSYEDIIEKNNEYLDEFREFLEKRNYREKVIEGHLDRVEYYINDYLMWGIPKHMENGCSLDVIGFIENRVNEKVMPPSVHNIDFFLGSIRLFYECMSEKKYLSKDLLKELNENIKEFKYEMVDDYYEKNPKELELYDVIETIKEAHGFGDGYININTGEKEFVTNDQMIDDDLDKLDGPGWRQVPEVNDYEIMNNFVLTLKNQNKANKLKDILHSKKAYRNFIDAIYEMGLEEEYYDFYDKKIEELAIHWLDEEGEELLS